jgi:hypothetical protein
VIQALIIAAIVLVCFIGGALAAAHWLPQLAPDPVSRIAFFTVCGLIGAALGRAGLRVYVTVRELETRSGVVRKLIGGGPRIAANGLLGVLADLVITIGLAAIVYLLASRGHEPREPS